MKINQLRAFLAVIETGTINRAADRLSLTQSAVSKSLRELEADLEMPLLVRTGKGMTLTEAGAVIADRARLINAEVARVRQDIAAIKGRSCGELRIGVSPVAASADLATAILAFKMRHSGTRLTIIEERPSKLLMLMRDGTLDFAISSEIPLESTGFPAIQLSVVKTVIGVRPDHPALHATSLDELLPYEWITPDPIDDETAPLFRCFSMQGRALPERIVHCASIGLYLELAKNSNAISIWSATPFNLAAFRQVLSPLALSDNIPGRNICLLSRDFHLLSRPARALMKEIRAIFSRSSDHDTAEIAGAINRAGSAYP
ncbi:LysR family transcriptional regulator [Achromobacter sp. Marseille-Q4954]|uniref:LysR family transcriptional regulator n=1 Tax=Achromobacter sp. Marseille-Q4954 TaxID=2942203 RepID=UPI0020744344|nr:LysR family transcriptional regulator [Achromobacter sp. Marseille-Q4954]